MNSQKKEIIKNARFTVARQFETILTQASGDIKKELAQLSHNIDFCFLSLEQNISTLRFLHMILPQQLKKAKEIYGIDLTIPEYFAALMKVRV
ncbi:hypothetical protein M3P05_18170 [Sansalvadorimonas sp. 2012CJ34-2]|uniref:Uncharacterized protein n=1 Tax=Parendozoicomonas callyspongiae TaxID=2942213 RepID=A0ABT0PKC4_9GAMM|nr:hypothetical protein [Sansalvadorimonas sp. 2012CJ34-2]MCL6271847.1 hypothetical protein [Sansalvadorimonas sp. 2012CJ34-2]